MTLYADNVKPYQLQSLMKWQKDADNCPMLDEIQGQKRCLVGGYRMVKPIYCTYDTCFARFAKNISG